MKFCAWNMLQNVLVVAIWLHESTMMLTRGSPIKVHVHLDGFKTGAQRKRNGFLLVSLGSQIQHGSPQFQESLTTRILGFSLPSPNWSMARRRNHFFQAHS